MSRCFPFPPPGYERKHKPEDLNLLREVKHKEKKHKEKKDKDKKKDKEKEKEGGDRKHKDKKDRKGKHKDKKEKHRDKKKDKEDRGKEKEKNNISEEATVSRNVEEENRGKLQSERPSKDSGCSLFHDQNGGKPSQSSYSSPAVGDSKFVPELDRRNRDEERGRRGQLHSEKFALLEKKKQEMVGMAAIMNSSVPLVEEKGDNKNKRIDRKMDPRGPWKESAGDIAVQNLDPMFRSKVERIPRLVDAQNGLWMEDKEKYKEKSDAKQNDRSKESCERMKKEDKVNPITENSKTQSDKLKEDGSNNTNTDLLKANNNVVNDGNIGKRKYIETNGFMHDNETSPNKMPKPSRHHLTENGRTIEGFQTPPSKSSHDKHAIHNNSFRVNGIIESQKPNPSVINPPKLSHPDSKFSNNGKKVSKIEDEITQLSRPPHPDSKYLAEVLTVPKIGDWSENDDQDWLFSKRNPPSSAEAKEDLHVWSEAAHIKSVDVFALPYVVPL